LLIARCAVPIDRVLLEVVAMEKGHIHLPGGLDEVVGTGSRAVLMPADPETFQEALRACRSHDAAGSAGVRLQCREDRELAVASVEVLEAQEL